MHQIKLNLPTVYERTPQAAHPKRSCTWTIRYASDGPRESYLRGTSPMHLTKKNTTFQSFCAEQNQRFVIVQTIWMILDVEVDRRGCGLSLIWKSSSSVSFRFDRRPGDVTSLKSADKFILRDHNRSAAASSKERAELVAWDVTDDGDRDGEVLLRV